MMNQQPVRLAKPIAFLRLARLEIITGGMLAYLLGTLIGVSITGSFYAFLFLVGFILTEIANLSAHFFDEYADVDTDSLTRRTLFTGGSGVLPAGLVPARTVLRVGTGFAAAAVLLTILSRLLGWISPVSLVILLLGLLGGWAYSMKPVQLERRGFAELTNAFIGGFLMPLMGLTVQTGTLTVSNVLVLAPVFLIVLADLLGAHWPDREADLAVGKRTLTVVLGNRTHVAFTLLVILAYALSLIAAPLPVVLLSLAALPFQIAAWFSFQRSGSPVPASLGMAVYLLAYGIGWILV